MPGRSRERGAGPAGAGGAGAGAGPGAAPAASSPDGHRAPGRPGQREEGGGVSAHTYSFGLTQIPLPGAAATGP